MGKFLKRILYSILDQKTYLKCLHKSFLLLYDLGLLKNNPEYKYHYFVKHLVKEGDHVIDLGANLGYFSKIFSRLVGEKGQVICIEPVPPFFEILQWALGKRSNVTLYPYALGVEDKTATIMLPEGFFRTGLANIPTGETSGKQGIVFDIEMKKGSSLLKDLSRIDYIKCDIEGYEEYVMPELKEIFIRNKPVLQIETWGSHRPVVFKLMEELGYVQYSVYKNKVVKNFNDDIEPGDFLFIHSSREMDLIDKLKKENLA